MKIAITLHDHMIPKEMVANFDETGLHLAPSGKRSFAHVGDIQVKSCGMRFTSL